MLSMNSRSALAEESNNTATELGEFPTTGFEDRDGEGWTTFAEELAFLEEVEANSERMTYSQVGTTVEGRPIHLVQLGYPEPPPDTDIATGRNMLIMGTYHGNEPSGREMALKKLRDLAFTEDPEMLELMGKATILFIPTVNPDGREENRRFTADNVDPNQDHFYLKTPETRAVASVLNEFKPDITLDAHERVAGQDISLLGPTNLNVDHQISQLSEEMILDYMMPSIEGGGFSTEIYPGIGFGWNSWNNAGLMHGLSVLSEASWQDEPKYRVDAQVSTAESVLQFYHERFDQVEEVVSEAPQRKAAAGAHQSEPFYLDGTYYREGEILPPSDEDVLDPPPCGYLLNTSQAERISRHINIFSLETEKVSEHGVFITMAQPMMTMIPHIMDEGSEHKLVEGLALYDCTNPGEIEPPGPEEPVQYESAFTEYEAGSSPGDWSSLWKESNWTIMDEPRRLEHQSIGDQLTRRALTWDKVGEVRGNVEMSAVVRAHDARLSKFQLGFHMSGSGELSRTRDAYYIDVYGSGPHQVRINRVLNGSLTVLGSTHLPFTFEEDSWYQVVVQREGETIRAKVWPFGEDEPKDWQVTAEDRFIDHGKVGLVHLTDGVINDWAFIGVGTAGDPAPRPPEDLLPKIDKSLLQRRVNEINDMDLVKSNYTEDSWTRLQDAIDDANTLLEEEDVTEEQLDQALAALNDAYSMLQVRQVQYQTDFSESEIGKIPANWSTLWAGSDWKVADNPSRLVHTVIPGEGRRALVMDEPGYVKGDVEVSSLVRTSGTGTTLFQLQLHASGDVDSENSYYMDLRTTGYIRINRNIDGAFSSRTNARLPFEVVPDEWYHAVFQREGNILRAKAWPLGEEEPDWQVEYVDDNLSGGYVGLGHSPGNVINEHAFFGVGVGGEQAPRAPGDLFDPEVDKTELQDLVDEIHAENLNEADYTEESWQTLQEALTAAEEVLHDPDAAQEEVDSALTGLNEARDRLEERETEPISAASMITSIEQFDEEGAFENDQVVRSLTLHLIAVDQYESQEEGEKAVRHMESFLLLLDHMDEQMSGQAYESLYADGELLIDKWK
ncbi:M14 family zinc carboxypeptidase [Virgibacillus sp. YIM 98842]|uniref:M14 family zinc carboxypeptidase n=1 Tax=Virgibacillus sp. YIM 98842 TaxID=2663533 RepID=UPI0013D99703|nr:M14 family zinc carboxypeptidase [Virgibacillus sp. YIM 98842]